MITKWLVRGVGLGALAMAVGCGSSSSESKAPGGSGGTSAAEPHKVGSKAPTWQLVDFQPQSPKTGTTYGLDAFQGTVTVAALLAGW